MKRLVRLARVLVVLSVAVFASSIFGGIYWRWINPPSSITDAWRDAISTFEVLALFSLFLAALAIYLKVGTRPAQ